MALIRLVKRLLGRKPEPEFPINLETDEGGHWTRLNVRTRLSKSDASLNRQADAHPHRLLDLGNNPLCRCAGMVEDDRGLQGAAAVRQHVAVDRLWRGSGFTRFWSLQARLTRRTAN
jgi:hypothetical protein